MRYHKDWVTSKTGAIPQFIRVYLTLRGLARNLVNEVVDLKKITPEEALGLDTLPAIAIGTSPELYSIEAQKHVVDALIDSRKKAVQKREDYLKNNFEGVRISTNDVLLDNNLDLLESLQPEVS